MFVGKQISDQSSEISTGFLQSLFEEKAIILAKFIKKSYHAAA
jgi:hypothetical protein